MNRKKGLAGLSLIMAFALVLAGCGSGNNDSASNNGGTEKTVLEYYTWTDEEAYMKKVVEAFNAQNSNIEVNMTTISNDADEYNTKIMNNLSGGSKMDVYSMNGTSSLGLYSSKNQLVDLSDRIKAENMDVGAYGPSFQDITEVLTSGKITRFHTVLPNMHCSTTRIFLIRPALRFPRK